MQALQERTYHDDPNAPETPAAPAALGIVNYGFAAGVVPTTTTVVSTSPNPGSTTADVTVTVAVVNALGGTPTGVVDVAIADGGSCQVPNYPTSTSCVVTTDFASGGVDE